MITKSVAVSGTVGKQAYASTIPVVLHGLTLVPLSGNGAYVKIRDGNASGSVIIEANSIASGGSTGDYFEGGIRFDKGMHVKVLGTGAVCYLHVS